MKKYVIGLKSISPIVFNTRQEELDEETSKLKKAEYGSWERENWKRKAMRDDKGNVIIPVIWIKSAFENACRHSLMVPNKDISTSKKSTYTRYAEAMYFQDTDFKCNDKDLILVKAYMGAQGKNSATKVLKSFPKLEKWNTNVTIIDPDGRMTIEEMKTLFGYAGRFEGIGDFRKVNCGRFEVTSIKEIK